MEKAKIKCDTCINQKSYTTGMDEYPSGQIILYCGKGHWENDSQIEKNDLNPDFRDNCKDFKLK